MAEPLFRVGDLVRLTSDAKENYDEEPFSDEVLKVVSVATSCDEHPGYDASADGMGLYDLEIADTGEYCSCSLYDYELEAV